MKIKYIKVKEIIKIKTIRRLAHSRSTFAFATATKQKSLSFEEQIHTNDPDGRAHSPLVREKP